MKKLLFLAVLMVGMLLMSGCISICQGYKIGYEVDISTRSPVMSIGDCWYKVYEGVCEICGQDIWYSHDGTTFRNRCAFYTLGTLMCDNCRDKFQKFLIELYQDSKIEYEIITFTSLKMYPNVMSKKVDKREIGTKYIKFNNYDVYIDSGDVKKESK